MIRVYGGFLIALLAIPLHRFESNTPPLVGRGWVRIYRRVDDVTLKLHAMELKTLSWELGDSEWSKKWGVMLSDLNRDVQKLRLCLSH